MAPGPTVVLRMRGAVVLPTAQSTVNHPAEQEPGVGLEWSNYSLSYSFKFLIRNVN